jgi:hypothetical protein
MKKQRGLKRYYRNLAFQNELDKMTWLDFNNPDIWFDRWHIHFDRKGYGNNSFKRRKPHLDKLFRHFEILIVKTKLLKLDYQLYAILLDLDSSSDALFLHTFNTKSNAFPFKISDLTSKSNLTNKQLNDYVSELKGYKILYGQAGENFCLIYHENVGRPFE